MCTGDWKVWNNTSTVLPHINYDIHNVLVYYGSTVFVHLLLQILLVSSPGKSILYEQNIEYTTPEHCAAGITEIVVMPRIA